MNKREKNLPKIIFVMIILCSTIFGISFSLINDSGTTTEEYNDYNKNTKELTKSEKDRIKISVPDSKRPKNTTTVPSEKKTVTGLLELGEFNNRIEKKKAKGVRNEN